MKTIKIIANSNTEVCLHVCDNNAEDLLIRLAKKFIMEYEPADMFLEDYKKNKKEKENEDN